MAKTKGVTNEATGPGNQIQLRFNEDAVSDKVSETGFNFFYDGGKGLLGALNVARQVEKFRPILVYNTDAVVHYVALSENSGMAAPATGADGVPIMPNTFLILSSGENTYIRSDGALVFGYMANDNVIEKN